MPSAPSSSDTCVREAAEAFLAGRRRPVVDGKAIFRTRNSHYTLHQGVLRNCGDASLLGAQLVGWLVQADEKLIVLDDWEEGARAVFVDSSEQRQVVVTSPTRGYLAAPPTGAMAAARTPVQPSGRRRSRSPSVPPDGSAGAPAGSSPPQPKTPGGPVPFPGKIPPMPPAPILAGVVGVPSPEKKKPKPLITLGGDQPAPPSQMRIPQLKAEPPSSQPATPDASPRATSPARSSNPQAYAAPPAPKTLRQVSPDAPAPALSTPRPLPVPQTPPRKDDAKPSSRRPVPPPNVDFDDGEETIQRPVVNAATASELEAEQRFKELAHLPYSDDDVDEPTVALDRPSYDPNSVSEDRETDEMQAAGQASALDDSADELTQIRRDGPDTVRTAPPSEALDGASDDPPFDIDDDEPNDERTIRDRRPPAGTRSKRRPPAPGPLYEAAEAELRRPPPASWEEAIPGDE